MRLLGPRRQSVVANHPFHDPERVPILSREEWVPGATLEMECQAQPELSGESRGVDCFMKNAFVASPRLHFVNEDSCDSNLQHVQTIAARVSFQHDRADTFASADLLAVGVPSHSGLPSTSPQVPYRPAEICRESYHSGRRFPLQYTSTALPSTAIDKHQTRSLSPVARVIGKIIAARNLFSAAPVDSRCSDTLAYHSRDLSDASASLLSLYLQLPSFFNCGPVDSSNGSAYVDDPQTLSSLGSSQSSLDIIDLYASCPTNDDTCQSRSTYKFHQRSTSNITVPVASPNMSPHPKVSKSDLLSASSDTPTRHLFRDLPTAYNSITSRSMRSFTNPNSTNMRDLPLPSTPANTRDGSSNLHTIKDFEQEAAHMNECRHDAQAEHSAENSSTELARGEDVSRLTTNLDNGLTQDGRMKTISNETGCIHFMHDESSATINSRNVRDPGHLPHIKHEDISLTQTSLVPEALHVKKDITPEKTDSIASSLCDSFVQSRDNTPTKPSPLVRRLSNMLDSSIRSMTGRHHNQETNLRKPNEHSRGEHDSWYMLENGNFQTHLSELNRETALQPPLGELQATALPHRVNQTTRPVSIDTPLNDLSGIPAGPCLPLPIIPWAPPVQFTRELGLNRSASVTQSQSHIDYGNTGDLFSSSQKSIEVGRAQKTNCVRRPGRFVELMSESASWSDGCELSSPLRRHNDGTSNVNGELGLMRSSTKGSTHARNKDEEQSSDANTISRDDHARSVILGKGNRVHSFEMSALPKNTGREKSFPLKPISSNPHTEIRAVQNMNLTDNDKTEKYNSLRKVYDDLWFDSPSLPITSRRTRQIEQGFLPPQAVTVPVPAFHPGIVKPGSQRYSVLHRNPFDDTNHSLTSSHPSEKDLYHRSSRELVDYLRSGLEYQTEDDDATDWETIPESRRTLPSILGEQSSFPRGSSLASLEDISGVPVHPGRDSYHHAYRVQHVARLDRTLFDPSSTYNNEASFPYRNANASPEVETYRVRHQPTTPTSTTQEKLITSSPSIVLNTASSGATPPTGWKYSKGDRSKSSPLCWQRSSLSIVHEHDNEGSHAKSSPSRVMTQTPLSDSFGTEPGPVLVANTPQPGTPTPGSRNTNYTENSSGIVHDWIMKRLRAKDHRMASTPLRYSNSFSKFSRLGPKANITGTPNGTGMREVGSSLAGESSPITLQNSTSFQLRNFAAMEQAFGFVPTSTSSPVGPSLASPPAVKAFNQSTTEFVARKDSFRNRMRSASVTDDDHEQRMDPNNKTPTQFSLIPHQYINLTNVSHVREPFDRPGHNNITGNITNHSFPPPFEPPPKLPSPHLFQPHDTSSFCTDSDLRKREELLSWVCFAVCAILPPLLVVYGYGYLDPLMCILSHHEFAHFGVKQKHVARWTGYTVTTALILAIVIFWIIVRTVPNSLPR